MHQKLGKNIKHPKMAWENLIKHCSNIYAPAYKKSIDFEKIFNGTLIEMKTIMHRIKNNL